MDCSKSLMNDEVKNLEQLNNKFPEDHTLSSIDRLPEFDIKNDKLNGLYRKWYATSIFPVHDENISNCCKTSNYELFKLLGLAIMLCVVLSRATF